MRFVDNTPANLIPVGSHVSASVSTAAKVTAKFALPTGLSADRKARLLLIQPDGGDIRICYDSTTPTSSVGFVVADGTVWAIPVIALTNASIFAASSTTVAGQYFDYSSIE